MKQPNLFEMGTEDQRPTDFAPAQAHSPTSIEAARAIEPDAESLGREVLAFIRKRGEAGATDDDLMELLAPIVGYQGPTLRPRRIKLMKDGLVRDSGRTRETKSGRSAVVWVAV